MAEGNISTMSVSESRPLFKLKSGLMHLITLQAKANAQQRQTHTRGSSLGASINMGGGLQKSNGKKKMGERKFSVSQDLKVRM